MAVIQADVAKDDASSPARASYAVTPHNTNEIGTHLPKALYVGTGGTIVMQLVNDASDITLTNIPNGSLLPLRPIKVKATGTTASGIVALF